MGTQVIGIAIIKVDGEPLRSEAGAAMDIGGLNRNEQVADRGDIGFSGQVKASQTDCVIQLDSTTSLTKIAGWSDVTINFEADTGQAYSVAHAFLKNTPKVTAGQGGKVALTFMGPPAIETGVSQS